MIKLVTGKNGIGKTYNLFWNNQNCSVSFCSQEIYNANMTVLEYLFYGVKDNSDEITKELRNIGIYNLNTKMYNLSGGQKQYVHVLSSFVRKADIYILDEPTNNLDTDSTKELLKLISKYQNECIKIITHDPRIFEFVGLKLEKIDLNVITEHTVELNELDFKEQRYYEESIDEQFIKNQIKKDRDILGYPIASTIVALALVLLSVSLLGDLIYDYSQLPGNVALATNVNYDCEYNKNITKSTECQSNIVSSSLNSTLSNIVSIADSKGAEHLLVTNDVYIESVYETLNRNNTAVITTYPQLDDLEYSTNSELCTTPNIVDGNIATKETEFTAGSTYIINKYGSVELNKIYDEGKLVGINKNNVLCTVSKSSDTNWYIDLLDENQFELYLEYVQSVGGINSFAFAVPDIIYIGTEPNAFAKEMINYTDMTTNSLEQDNNYIFKLNIKYYFFNIVFVTIGFMLFQLWYKKYIIKAANQQYANTIHLGVKVMKYDNILKVMNNMMIKNITILYICGLCIILFLRVDPSLLIGYTITYMINILFMIKLKEILKNVI